MSLLQMSPRDPASRRSAPIRRGLYPRMGADGESALAAGPDLLRSAPSRLWRGMIRRSIVQWSLEALHGGERDGCGRQNLRS